MFNRWKRCNKNRRSRRLYSNQYQSLEQRRCLASVGWDGVGQGSVELTYFLGEAPADVSQAVFADTVEEALDVWSDAADIKFAETKTPGLDDSLDITFAQLDGEGGTLARAFLPDDLNRSQIAGDVKFDVAENWEVGNAKGSSAFDLLYVAVHEIGHALGLGHTTNDGSVLKASVSPNQQFAELSAHDIEAIQSLYAAPREVNSPVQSSSVPAPIKTPAADVERPETQVENESSDDTSRNRRNNSTQDHVPFRRFVFQSGKFRFTSRTSFSPTASQSGVRTLLVSLDPAVFRQLTFFARTNFSG